LPVFVAFIAYQISAAIALYWITSNIFTIIQEWRVRKTLA
jgi:membrane protein insertase Oxa1/YidC/SpoIIIJ